MALTDSSCVDLIISSPKFFYIGRQNCGERPRGTCFREKHLCNCDIVSGQTVPAMGRTHTKTRRGWYCADHKRAYLTGKSQVSKTASPLAGWDRMMAYKLKKSIDRPSVNHTVMSPPLTILWPGTSPTKPQKHTKTDTRPERSLAAHEGSAVVTTNSFQTNFFNSLGEEVISKITKAVSEWVSKVEAAETQVAGHESIPALLNKIAKLLRACSSVN